MESNTEILSLVVSLLIKSVLLAAGWAGTITRIGLSRTLQLSRDEKEKLIVFLLHRLYQLETHNEILLNQLNKRNQSKRNHYSIRDRLYILWHMEYFKIPRRRAREYFGIARSTLYRWLHKIDDQESPEKEPVNKTPAEIAAFVWKITKANIDWGRVRIANQLALLKIFISASTVRNILNRPKPPKDSSPNLEKSAQNNNIEEKSRSIPAWHPNHVWSVDLTIVWRWRLWPTYVLAAIDHFSRKVMTVTPLESPNAERLIDALERAFKQFGAPKHVISDQESVFKSADLADLLGKWNVKHRFGAIGKHGSIAVTERVIKTLKYEWLKRVPLIQGFEHLSKLCNEFQQWYNQWRPHMSINGARPDDVYKLKTIPEKPPRDAKTVPPNIETFEFKETRITGYRLKKSA